MTTSINIEMVNYSEKAIAIFGDTKQIKDELKNIGGKFNPFLNRDGIKTAGWIFSKKYSATVEELIQRYSVTPTKIETVIVEDVKPVIEKELIFNNDNCYFEVNFERKEINGSDKRDQWNAPKCYNRKVQKFKKAVEALKQRFNSSMSMYDVMNILDEFNMGMRSYCSMD